METMNIISDINVHNLLCDIVLNLKSVLS